MRKLNLLRSATLVAILLVFSALQTFAQTRVVTGTVTDQNGKGVPGVTVSVKGTNTATQTDAAGMYRINASDNSTLVFTSVGFASREMPVGSNSTMDASLTSSADNMSEVVVIGYGTARKRDLTGAVSSISEKNFNKGVYTAPDQLIQGKASGVQVINNSGAPGGATTVRIRGTAAVTGSGQPLYVVDGVPLSGGAARPGVGDLGFGGSNPGGNPLNFLNPGDIASIDILKDASATAIYGSRAAYGVVLVTTKKGISGAPRVEFSASVGQSSVMKKIEVLDADQFRKALTYYGLSNAADKGSSVDAFDEITRKGLVQNYGVGISGGTDGARYRISLGALNQEGIVRKTGIKKYTANLSSQFKFLDSKRLGLDLNVIPSTYQEQIAPISNNAGSRGSLIGNALQWNPTERLIVKNAAGQDSLNVVRGGDLINPLALQRAYDDRARVTTILASISPYVKITNWLEYRFLYSIYYSTGTRRISLQPFINFNDVLDKGRVRVAEAEQSTQQFTHTLNITKDLTSKLNLSGLLGYEAQKYTDRGFEAGGFGQSGTNAPPSGFGFYGLDLTDYIQFSNPTNRSISSYNAPDYSLQSMFARATLNFDDRFLVTGTIRRDGSSKFGKDNRYGYFPSFSAAWNIFKEDFFPKTTFINLLKIRGGWGKTGNQEFPTGSSQFRYGFNGNATGFGLVNNGNDALKWQEDRQYNIGLDATLWNNRISITADYFNKATTDLLFPVSDAAQPAAGSALIWKNLDGTITNKGFEASINATLVDKKNFGWDLGVNGTTLKNEVDGFSFPILTGGLDGQGISGTTVQVIRNGLPMNAFVTRQFLGMDKATGLANYTDGGDVLYYVGNSLPKRLLGLSTTVRFMKFSFNANMNGAFGYYIYNNTLNNVINVGSINNGKNIAVSVYEDPIKESIANPVTASSRFLENGNYLKLANATLSYGVGNMGKYLKGGNIYVTGQNLFVITKFTGFDPEVNVDKRSSAGVPSASIEYIPYPSARTVTVGVNFSF